jgi:hypothetical protein
VTYIHRCLWPAVVRLAAKFGKSSLAAIREKHTTSGSHRVVETPFPEWLPTDVKEAADRFSEEEAISQFGEEVAQSLSPKKGRARSRQRRKP